MWILLFIAMLSVGVQGHTLHKPRVNFDLPTSLLCTANTTDYNMDDMKAATSTFTQCMNGVLDTEAIGQEIDEAMRTKAFEGVFKKYCAKAQPVKACILNVITGLSPCLEPELATHAKNVYSNVIDFICYNEGARLTSFFKEDGPKCVEEKHSAFATCEEEASNQFRKAGVLVVTEKERCTIGGPYIACVVAAVKTCTNPVPGQLAQELRQVYMSSLNCPEDKEQTHTGSYNRLG